jgi:CubicO group peptidase (beta-lactamase class C family)
VREMMTNPQSTIFIQSPYPAGSEAKYSNSEYIILSKIAEKVTHRPFGELIKEHILTPAKMSRSDFTYNPTIRDNQVYGTIQFFSISGTVMRFILDDKDKDFYEGSMLWLKEFDIQWKAAGGLVASIEDIAKFLSAYHANKLFSQKTKNLFIHNPKVKVNSWLSTQDDVYFGIGWYHIFDKGEFFYQHQGLGPGFRTIMRIYPKHDLSFVILTSQTSTDIDDWADSLIKHIISEDNNETESI